MGDPLKDALTLVQNVKKQIDTLIDTGIAQIKATAPELPVLPAGLPSPTEVLKTFEGMLPPGLPKFSELMQAPTGGASQPAETKAYAAPAEVVPAEVVVTGVAPVEHERRLWYPRG